MRRKSQRQFQFNVGRIMSPLSSTWKAFKENRKCEFSDRDF